MEEIKKLIDESERNGSGWVLHQLQYLDLGKILFRSNTYFSGLESKICILIFEFQWS